MRKFFYILLILATTVLQSCDFDQYKSKTTIGEMSMYVDENIEPLMKVHINEFMRLNPESKMTMTTEPTNNVFARLLNKETKLIAVTRNLTAEEQKYIADYKIEVIKFEFAVDGIAFIVNPLNPAKRVTSEDLRKILSGEYKNWSQLTVQDTAQNVQVRNYYKGKDKINLYIQRKNSATYDFVKDSVLNGGDYSTAAIICSTSSQMLDLVRNDKNAIGISNSSWLSLGEQDEQDTTVQPLRISLITQNGVQRDFVQFHQGLIYNKSYPYRRPVYIMTTQVDMGLANGFMTYLLAKEGQKIVLKNGLVPVSQPVRTIQLN